MSIKAPVEFLWVSDPSEGNRGRVLVLFYPLPRFLSTAPVTKTVYIFGDSFDSNLVFFKVLFPNHGLMTAQFWEQGVSIVLWVLVVQV